MWQKAVHLAFLTASFVTLPAFAAMAEDPQITRGKYLVTLGGCSDCHTPGYFFGNPDMSRYLGGSDVGFEIPGQGVFVASNITPDNGQTAASWRRSCRGTLLRNSRRRTPRQSWLSSKVWSRSATRFPVRSNPGKRFRASCSGLCHQAKPQPLRLSRLGPTKIAPRAAALIGRRRADSTKRA